MCETPSQDVHIPIAPQGGNDMSAECLALVAAVCLNQSSRAEIVANSLWTGARIEVDGATIMSTIRADASPFPDRRLMPQYCLGRDCVHYHMFCESTANRYMCRISYFERGNGFRRRLEIVADNEVRMASLFSTLRIAALPSQTLVPLAAFRIRSSTSFPPYCRPREDRGCR